MSVFIGLASGFLIAVMNYFNAELSAGFGNYLSVVIIHVVGLVCIIPFASKGLLGKIKAAGKLPLWYWTAGFVGILTTIFCNISINEVGVSLAIALSLLGQTCASAVIDQFGLFGYGKFPISKRKILSIGCIVVGSVVMILW